MNEFKENLKIDFEKKKRLDDKICANIAKLLSDMSKNLTDKEERIQILDRMINLNIMFEDFDSEIEVLRKERERKKLLKTGEFDFNITQEK